ncbi:MAG: M28 family peptidase, partial [Sphingomonas sp.]
MLRSLLLPLLLLAAPAAAQTLGPTLTPEQAALKSHVQFLASDALRGREAGTRDFDVAAEYVASQMEGMGLVPAGVKGSWFQPVQLVTFRPSEKAAWTLTRGSTAVPFQFGVDFVNGPVPSTPDFKAEGGVVFAGYGIVYPEGKRDDYKGLDVKGKIVALLPGTPAGLPNEVTAHFGDDDQKARLAEARGAKAVIILESAARRAEYAFEAIVPFYDYPRSTWAGPDGVAHVAAPGAPVVGYVSQVGAAKLFEGAKVKWADVLAAEKKGTKIPTGALTGTLATASKTRVRSVETRNVIGKIQGSDPSLRDQYIVLSAHLDHVGVGEPVNGDRIYNGAMDNSIGTSMILEIARAIQAA